MNPKWLKSTFVLIFLLVACANIFAEEIAPSAEEIAKIEKRGKQIADYERAAIRATDLLLASNPDQSKLDIYLAIDHGDAWTVYFGKISDDGNEFIIGYSFPFPEGLFNETRIVQYVKAPPKDILPFAKAIKLVSNSISIPPEAKYTKYNTNVFREEDGTITVYLIPGNENPDVILLGGDFKISISPDGTKVLNKTELHHSILEMPSHMDDGTKLAGAFHTHTLGDLPTETDVAIVLLNPQLAPHYIVGQTWLSRIDANGKITILGKAKEILEIDELSK